MKDIDIKIKDYIVRANIIVQRNVNTSNASADSYLSLIIEIAKMIQTEELKEKTKEQS